MPSERADQCQQSPLCSPGLRGLGGGISLKRSLLPWLCCPPCRGTLSLAAACDNNGEVESGALHCADCQASYPIIRAIPRFVSPANYADNFSFQWNRFRRTQLDSCTGTTISRDRFLGQT